LELGTTRDVFDVPARRPPRLPQNFFATWQTSSALLSGSTVDIPAAAWALLAASPQVFYRLLTSTAENGWVNVGIYPPSDRLPALPSIAVAP
jgi:hypothetical protein